MDNSELTERQLSSKTVYDGRILSLQLDRAALPDGREVAREVVRHCGGVAIAAVDERRRVWLVEQYRYPYGEVIVEVPAGKLEPGEDPDAAAARELREETGLSAAALRRVAVNYPSPGYTDERLYLYIATGLTEVGQQPDDDEFLRVSSMPLAEAAKMVLRGEIPDGKTQALLLMAQQLIDDEKEASVK